MRVRATSRYAPWAMCLFIGWTAAVCATELKPWNGDPTPPLVLKDLAGREHRLADYAGKVVVVNFWATWCEPCREEMPAFNRLRAKLGDTEFAILGVNMGEGEGRIGEFLKQVPVDFPILLDRDGASSKTWRVRVLPYSVVLGPDARIRYTAVGELNWNAPDIESTLRQLLPAR